MFSSLRVPNDRLANRSYPCPPHQTSRPASLDRGHDGPRRMSACQPGPLSHRLHRATFVSTHVASLLLLHGALLLFYSNLDVPLVTGDDPLRGCIHRAARFIRKRCSSLSVWMRSGGGGNLVGRSFGSGGGGGRPAVRSWIMATSLSNPSKSRL